jgi:hypothetical protein
MVDHGNKHALCRARCWGFYSLGAASRHRRSTLALTRKSRQAWLLLTPCNWPLPGRSASSGRYGRRQSVHRVRLRKPKRLPFLLARVSRTGGQRAYVCSGCHRWSRCVGPAGARRACRRLDGLSDRGGVSIGDHFPDTMTGVHFARHFQKRRYATRQCRIRFRPPRGTDPAVLELTGTPVVTELRRRRMSWFLPEVLPAAA